MKKIKLKDIFHFEKKSTIKAGDGLKEGMYPFFTSSSILKKRINISQFKGNCLIFGTGGSPSIHFANTPFSASTDCIVVTPKNDNYNPKFIYYFLIANLHILKRGFKGAGLQHISKKYIQNISVPKCSIESQNKIVEVLDKASCLIQKRQKSIALLDDLLRATFFDMFGDLSDIANVIPRKPIIECCVSKEDIRCGPFGTQLSKSEFRTKGVPIWGIKHVNSEFKLNTTEFVTKEKADKLKNYTLQPRDILMTRKGCVGNCHIYPEHFNLGIMHSDILRIRVNENIINPFFLLYQFKYNDELKWQINRVSQGAVMAGINVSKLKKVFVKVPDITLQNKFENNYKRINALVNNLSSSNINILFNSILQRAFSGQLNFDLSVELDALLNNLKFDKMNEELELITNDNIYLNNLTERLNEKNFETQELYERAKKVAFQLLKMDEFIEQKYDAKSKSLKLVEK